LARDLRHRSIGHGVAAWARADMRDGRVGHRAAGLGIHRPVALAAPAHRFGKDVDFAREQSTVRLGERSRADESSRRKLVQVRWRTAADPYVVRDRELDGLAVCGANFRMSALDVDDIAGNFLLRGLRRGRRREGEPKEARQWVSHGWIFLGIESQMTDPRREGSRGRRRTGQRTTISINSSSTCQAPFSFMSSTSPVSAPATESPITSSTAVFPFTKPRTMRTDFSGC